VSIASCLLFVCDDSKFAVAICKSVVAEKSKAQETISLENVPMAKKLARAAIGVAKEKARMLFVRRAVDAPFDLSKVTRAIAAGIL